MAIFGHLELEAVVQENDRTRLNAKRSFKSSDEADITLVEIEPEASSGFIDVTPSTATDADEYFLDWSYATAGAKVVSLRITTDGAPSTVTSTITVVDAATDGLWSTDAMLRRHEPEIMNLLREGRNTFLDQHRLAKQEILDYLDREGYTDIFNDKFTAAAFTDTEEVRAWSKFIALRLIYEGVWNDNNDGLRSKAASYASRERDARSRAVLRIDTDGDGTANQHEEIDIQTAAVFRR